MPAESSGSRIARSIAAKPVDPVAATVTATATVLVVLRVHELLGITDADLLKLVLSLGTIAMVWRAWWEGRKVP